MRARSHVSEALGDLLDDRTKGTVLMACVAIILGLSLNCLSIILLNNAEKDLAYADDPEEYRDDQAWLNNTKGTSRILNFLGYSLVVLGCIAIIAIILIDTNKKVESLIQQINNIPNQHDPKSRLNENKLEQKEQDGNERFFLMTLPD